MCNCGEFKFKAIAQHGASIIGCADLKTEFEKCISLSLKQPPADYESKIGLGSRVATSTKTKTFNSFPYVYLQIMSPPAYSDLGKNARDVFGKGYHFGLWKLDLKTKTNSGVEFTSAGHSNQDTGKVFGSLETKYKVKEYGLTFSEKWNTDNTLSSEVAVENQLVKGLKLSFDGSFAPQTG